MLKEVWNKSDVNQIDKAQKKSNEIYLYQIKISATSKVSRDKLHHKKKIC
jgi:hypothetical protein